jgi:hypothetical protein
MIPLTFQSACRSAGQIGGKAFWNPPVAKPAFFPLAALSRSQKTASQLVISTASVRCFFP